MKFDIPKNDEEALENALDEIRELVTDKYWNGKWSQGGATLTVHDAFYRG